MLRFQYLTITHPEAELVALLRKMKDAKKGAFLYQKTLATEYARNLFKSEDYVGCFKTRRTSLSESSVWVVITGDELRVTNITPSAIATLGITEYNLILNAFYQDFVAKFIDESWIGCVSISGDRVFLSEILSEETYRALTVWEAGCDKDNPISHPMDLKNWMDFVTLLHRDGTELSVSDFGQWLFEDRRWPSTYNAQIVDLESNLEYSLGLLNHYDGTDL